MKKIVTIHVILEIEAADEIDQDYLDRLVTKAIDNGLDSSGIADEIGQVTQLSNEITIS